MDEEESMDNWKRFQGTELGSLLGSIYGNPNRTKINYPKPKAMQIVHDKKEFIPGGAKLNASDSRKATRRNVKVAVPKPVGNRHENQENIKPVDYIPRRRGVASIQQELDDIRMRQEHYRPAFVKPVSVVAEKDRLTQIFTFKGGKALPEELTMPVGEAPFEVQNRRKEIERLNTIRQKRGLTVVRSGSQRAMSTDEEFAQQIQREIEERAQHLEDMRQIGLKPVQEKVMMRELAQRVDELQRLHNKL
jgi:hypothetical protein